MGRQILAAAAFLRGARRLKAGSSQNWLPHKPIESRAWSVSIYQPDHAQVDREHPVVGVDPKHRRRGDFQDIFIRLGDIGFQNEQTGPIEFPDACQTQRGRANVRIFFGEEIFVSGLGQSRRDRVEDLSARIEMSSGTGCVTTPSETRFSHFTGCSCNDVVKNSEVVDSTRPLPGVPSEDRPGNEM